MKNITFYPTSLGLIGIVEKNGAIIELFFGKKHKSTGCVEQETPVLREAARQLEEYLDGKLKSFNLPLAPEGTDFQQTVWAALRDIPYGETRTYKQVAEVIGKPEASRTVGAANNKNPILIITPCHRVIGTYGKLVGYAAGLAVKEKLLEMEKNHVNG
ncbi:methylated-DNA--protein-cysteine methyltransferase Ogt [Gottschalkia purinilytica]|uniref:Methylated-DNA--protein-cysteine methyltransferase n=1 Tax=Gottschalkia purinilytica TaxID=1503 RepID=A0A0L0WCB6_GOTPU|nr:methylated-DNA--[protein]-cysteine S-methyltransferase [Gottschalkia purinilytica]KNF09113.1 methylated-DNA--protein-cysteine methyltransferase Ogt [Gottschalkia purinilytica]